MWVTKIASLVRVMLLVVKWCAGVLVLCGGFSGEYIFLLIGLAVRK